MREAGDYFPAPGATGTNSKRANSVSGIGAGGKPWSVTMQHHYGYFKRSEGSDGENIDCFIGPHPESEIVFVKHTPLFFSLEGL